VYSTRNKQLAFPGEAKEHQSLEKTRETYDRT
jgi:hypothetical protein